MRTALVTTGLLIFVLALAGSAAEKTATVHGYVLDSACVFTKSLDKPVNRARALACAKGGSPLVILADDKNIYWPISGAIPAAGQNPKLLKFAGPESRRLGQGLPAQRFPGDRHRKDYAGKPGEIASSSHRLVSCIDNPSIAVCNGPAYRPP